MARDTSDTTPLTTRAELIAWFAEGEKPREQFRIGTEHEKIPFYRADNAPVPYAGERGIRALLEGLRRETGWEPIIDLGNIIGLHAEEGGAISIEPGGQFELSGAALPDVHATVRELDEHLAATKRAADPLGIGFLDLGMSPKWRREETPVMPKSRYKIMAGYMPKVGQLGLDMMLRTATVQVNVDFASEADMVRKLRASLALQPVATALFANSPFTDGRPNGFLSRRSEIWRDTDADRTGMLGFAFEAGFGYEGYVDWLLDMPMYFVKRGDTYHDVSGASFRDLMAGKLPQLPGEYATVSDWANHASTAFPEVRLKRFLEMRGSDVGGPDMIAAQAAFWTGLLYDEAALDAALDLTKGWSAQGREAMRATAPRLGLATPVCGRSLGGVAAEALAIARAGLQARARRDAAGRDETIYLQPLEAIVAAGRSRAEDRLSAYEGSWQRSVEPAFEACIF
ncbi:glutamate--cysteine ligase [Methylobacterium gregans]|uniref:Glutamate--cysteine ligase n=1 Tax=Methylobacterium gregans TaxID=374424 RepID=A0AA37HMN2_9HYPH|nr:glutamate--cysteine ligase [Methylobacterium gregans]MDQ0520734.1 glutamate--cysteine ligase [Methylobacterium gregans]GJD78370.1 Glutamate--cysteine ligase EgtA [Methylobacterium gregans]GLS53317.1 glutamate--cysteine ligase [Methylobacterium gregans]